MCLNVYDGVVIFLRFKGSLCKYWDYRGVFSKNEAIFAKFVMCFDIEKGVKETITSETYLPKYHGLLRSDSLEYSITTEFFKKGEMKVFVHFNYNKYD